MFHAEEVSPSSGSRVQTSVWLTKEISDMLLFMLRPRWCVRSRSVNHILSSLMNISVSKSGEA